MTKITTVIFDVGGVLHASNNATVKDLAQELQLEESAVQQIWKDQIPLLGSGQIDETAFWQQVKAAHGIRQVEVAENLLGRAFAQTLVPHAKVLALVTELRRLGLKLAILSNTIEPHARANRQAGYYDGFDRVLLSHEVGLRKPDPAIYQHALDELGIEPEQAVFIDDDPANAEAATKLGMKGITYTSPEQLATDLRALIPGLPKTI
jgi:epoxide hydrolase-like predicted phosphatase